MRKRLRANDGKTSDMGTLMRVMQTGDRLTISLGENPIGFIECVEVPTRCRMAFTFHKGLRIDRPAKSKEDANAGADV